MLNIRNYYSNIGFGSSTQSPPKCESSLEYADKSKTSGLQEEELFRRKSLLNTRPILLKHTSVDYSEWLDQFETAEERNLALKILQNYVYIDLNNARSAYRKIHKELQEEIDINKTKFSSLGVSKSGAFMGYLYRQANKMRAKGPIKHEHTDYANLLKEEHFITSSQLQDSEFNKDLVKQGYENIVIIDDMIGNGDAFTEYLTPQLIDSLKQYKNIYYVTLVKDPDGEKKIRDKFQDLDIKFKSAQTVYKYDAPENKAFTDKEKIQIKEMIEKYGNKIAPELVNKYSRSKLFVSFDWNTPGNVPMLFNYSTPEWQGLFNRYNGLEQNEVGTKFDFMG